MEDPGHSKTSDRHMSNGFGKNPAHLQIQTRHMHDLVEAQVFLQLVACEHQNPHKGHVGLSGVRFHASK